METLSLNGNAIARSMDKLAKARGLLDKEQDPLERRALQSVIEIESRHLGQEVDDLLTHTNPIPPAGGVAKEPAAYPILREALAPLKAHRGSRDAETAMIAGKAALQRLSWIFAHREELSKAAAQYKGLATAERYARENEEAAKRRAEEDKK
jgi:hypothetical protein